VCREMVVNGITQALWDTVVYRGWGSIPPPSKYPVSKCPLKYAAIIAARRLSYVCDRYGLSTNDSLHCNEGSSE